MADFTSSPMAGDYRYDDGPDAANAPPANRLTALTNAAGAVVSLALIAGIGVWGYKLLARDVTGIPVVQAASGEMRVRPENPGGELAQHQGLSVNAVAAEGAAAAPADRLILAPRPIDITENDDVMPPQRVAAGPQTPTETATTPPAPERPVPDVAAALQSGNVDDLVAQLTEGVTPLSELPDDTSAIIDNVTQEVVQEAQDAQEAVAAAAPVLDAPGVRQSLRPQKRPATRAVVTPASLTGTDVSSAAAEVDADSLPVGTRLAQLGAFDSAEVARDQWDQMQGRFGAYLEGKQRVVQKASSGGRVFYRLRAMGFEDIADARRFCSALVAENAECIPVVTR